MPKSRRTFEEVAMAKARKEELKDQLARAEQDRIDIIAKARLEEDMALEAEEASAVRSLQDVLEAPPNPAETTRDDQEPSLLQNGTSSEDEESDDDGIPGKTDLCNAKVTKKVRTCESAAHGNTNSYP
jgi:hypothetical protein